MLTLDEYRQMAEQAIGAIAYPKGVENLYEPIAYTMQGGGKRVRPTLTLLACDALGGKATDAVLPAVGLELFHNFTLLHDDVMDKADVRRGRPTVHRRWGDNTAILCGDTMLTMASQYVSRVDPAILPAVTDLFNQTAIEVYEGQQLDMDYEKLNNVTVDDYMRMIRLKTSVLLGCACKLGALVAHADEQEANKLYDMGVNLGLAFQLQDDVLDVWGDAETFGKEIGGDIMNNKKTYLVVSAFEMAQKGEASEEVTDALRRWFTDEYAIKQQKVPAVTALFEQLGLREKAEKAISEYDRKAVHALQQVQMSNEGRQAFHALIQSLVGRKR